MVLPQNGHVPPYPYASNLASPDTAARLGAQLNDPGPLDREPMGAEAEGLREEIRRMVLEELSRIVRG